MPFDVREYEYHRVTREGVRRSLEPVAVERDLTLIVNGKKRLQLMASPSDLEALGYGVLISSGIISNVDQVLSIHVEGDRITAEVAPSDGREERSPGTLSMEDDLAIEPDFVWNSIHYLETDTYRRTSGAHSATLLDEGCRPIAIGVDAGRHNAYDKAIGKVLMEGIDPSRTVLLASGRQSAELVSKAVNAGIPIVISKAAPISSGIDAARGAGLTLVCFADENKFSVFSGIERIRPLPRRSGLDIILEKDDVRQ
jgi:FdhD protein